MVPFVSQGASSRGGGTVLLEEGKGLQGSPLATDRVCQFNDIPFIAQILDV